MWLFMTVRRQSHLRISYDVMKHCVAISILDFSLTGNEKYHTTYLLRDEDGRIFTKLVELHVIELNKKLKGCDIDEWIRFFNVKTQGGLDMLRTQTGNIGILEAIEEVEHMSLGRWAKARYEEHLKRVMDRKAEDAYVFDQGVEQGEKRILTLIARMNTGGDADKVAELSDPKVIGEMEKKYGIE